jgi:coenzyme F420-dependent glucose-6-phosphate dehydrogenase
MVEFGYTLSSEEWGPRELVKWAVRAEEVGFAFALISDHFHPWIDAQGESPFVWTVIGAVAQATERLRLGTGVTCPTIRIHPAIVAQAAATSAAMMPGRFFLGVGSGENLNEHITGSRWPAADERQDMLEEAIGVIRQLWEGGNQTHRGRYFTVENARVYTLPDEPPPLYVAAGGTNSAKLAARAGDGMIGVSPDAEVLKTFDEAGGKGKPRYGQLHVCWAKDPQEATQTVAKVWPNTAITGELGQELPLPRHFEQAAQMLDAGEVDEKLPTGPDPRPYVKAIQEYADAGYTHVYLHQVGPDQEGFFGFWERELASRVGGGSARAA